MNPNFFQNMSPEQMQNSMNMMNPEMMKSASNMISGMSDSQLRLYLSQMGMPGMDPQMFRNMAQNMSNMNDTQFNAMKNMAQNNYMNNMNKQNYNNNNSYNTTTNTSNNNKSSETIVDIVIKMKNDGNKLFKEKKYEEAIKKYYETIEEIKTAIDKDKYKNDLNDVEKSCRLNIANCKLKTEDYEGVINECSIVLEINKCFKAYYYMGLALFNKKKYDKAYRYLDNANAIGTKAEKEYSEPRLKECKVKLDEIKKKEREERKKKEEEEEKNKKEKQNEEKNSNDNNNINNIKDEKKEDNNIENENKKDRNNIKINEDEKNKINENSNENDSKLDNLRNTIEKEKLKNKKNSDKEEKKIDEENDIKVEDTIDTSSSKINNNNINTNMNNNYNNNNFNNFNYPPQYNQEYIKEAQKRMNEMSDDQLNLMLGQMKQMDNQTLKNMMAAQGMNLSDDQINMMKNSLSPELIRMVQNQNFQPPMGNMNHNNVNTNINNINNNINNNPQQPQMPNLNNMDFSQMMEFIKKNPELLKMAAPGLSKMMGGKDIDPEIMMKSMENIMWIFSIPGRIKRFMLSWRGICFIVFIIAIFYGIFKR